MVKFSKGGEKMPELQCQLCGNTAFSENASFCKACGTPIHNTCTNEACGELNDLDAAYCECCGWETIYNKLDVVKSSKPPEIPF